MLPIVITGTAHAQDDLSKCLTFKAPAQRSIITVPSCTLGVEESCKPIHRTAIKVRYFPENSDTTVVKTLSHIYRSPFQQIWDLAKIPNQLFVGIGIIIEVNFVDGDVAGLFREGIFLAHKGVTYPDDRPVFYEYPGSPTFSGDSSVVPIDSSRSVQSQLYWNEKSITFRIRVNDPSFSSNVAEDVFEKCGVEVCIDPSLKRRPYPTEDVMIYAIPLSNKPVSRITYKPVFSDSGNFRLNAGSLRSAFEHSSSLEDGEGFTVTFSIPSYLFGKNVPDKMAYNIIAKTSDSNGAVHTASIIGAGGYNNYSPYLWHTLAVVPKPFFKTRWILWLFSFLAGLAFPLVIYGCVRLFVKDRPVLLHINRPEEKNKVFQRVKDAIHLHITNHEVSVADIAAELASPPKHIESMVRKVTGMSFKNYVMYLRTEIVCERLRSSHSSEVSIAESCGFKNVNEMERFFRKFHHTTPFNFRRTQQISQLQ